LQAKGRVVLKTVWRLVRKWFDTNFTLKGLAALMFLIFTGIPDWQYYGEYWKGELHTITQFVVFSPWGRVVILLLGVVVIWMDHRSVMKRRAHNGGVLCSITRNISIELKQVKIKADPLTVFVSGENQLRCETDVFVQAYVVNTMQTATTLKTAELSMECASGHSYRGLLQPIGNDFQIVRNAIGWREALATVFGQAKPLNDLAAMFNSHSFVHAHGTLGWLRFTVQQVLTNDIESLRIGEKATAKVVITDGLGRSHSGTLTGPWESTETTVVNTPDWKKRTA
jgi:hypothetical protein